jgi:ornithine cyclodeaminase/alanine dehydrogenase-like protein (mu-crystallin family)
MPTVPVLNRDAVLAAVSPLDAIRCTHDAFVAFQRGGWEMPSKVYLPSGPYGDFRAMPALGDGIAILKWVTSFPGNAEKGLPTVNGVVCVSDATTGEPLMLLDARSVTALRTGAVAAVATAALAREGSRTVGLIGCGVHGVWAARCLAAAGFAEGVCHDRSDAAAKLVAEELGWAVGTRQEALEADVVCCVTPGFDPMVSRCDLSPGQHFNMLGADGPGKSEATVDAVAACTLFCDEWNQASHGGELTAAVAKGLVTRADVTELGDVLVGAAAGRPSNEAVTLFDSTGLAIQDLAIAQVALDAWRAGSVPAIEIEL